MDIGRKSKVLENPDCVPVKVNFIPHESVSGRDWVGVMVVMPAISETQQRDPPIIG
jgi:hypothetical protein